METHISIHSYFGCFHEKGNKMRPAFRDENGILWALTHSVPKNVPFITIPKKDIQGEHFKPKKEVVFLLKARNQNARRYNNAPGGIIKFKNSTTFKMEKTIKFIPVQLPTATELGLSPEGASQLDTINATLQKQLRGEPLDEFEKQYTELPGWDTKASAFLTAVTTDLVSSMLVGDPKTPADLSDTIDLLNQLAENPEDAEALELLAIEWGMEVPKAVDPEVVSETLDSIAQSAHDQKKEVVATENEHSTEETTDEQITEETPATEEVTAETLPAPQKPIINAVGAASTLQKLKKTNEHLKAASAQMIDVLKNINEAMVGQLEATTEFAEQVIADQQALPAQTDAETVTVEESAG